MTHWLQLAFGDLPDGSRVMVISVSAEYRPRVRNREFPAVLFCREPGLHRLWRDGRSRLLAPDFRWPTLSGSKAEESLRPLVPKEWGSQHGSGCVIRPIAQRILRANTANLARLLLAWFRGDRAAHSDRLLRGCQPMPPVRGAARRHRCGARWPLR